MSVSYYVKRNDRSPAITDTLLDKDGAPVNLSAAAVRFHAVNRLGVVAIDALATGPGGGALDTTGQVRYALGPTDTLIAGMYYAEWQVTYAGGLAETFPNADLAYLFITADLA